MGCPPWAPQGAIIAVSDKFRNSLLFYVHNRKTCTMLQLADRPKMLVNTEVIGATMVFVRKSTGNQVVPIDWFEMGPGGLIDSIR